ncbi:MAG: tetratricopeptide repeat protein [Betaproteobacteria bacterium]|nr:tetratricopeptide repeat protein [Betaproteobacteria bacterium]
MNLKSLRLAFLTLPLVACAQTAAVAQPEVVKPAPGLDGPLLYQFLLGEIAGQRGELKLAADAYSDLADKIPDARIAKRATEIASYSRQPKLALKNALLWVELDPASAKGRQTVVSLLLSAGQVSDAKPHLDAWLRLGKPEETFLQLHGLLARQNDKLALSNLVSDLAAAYPGLPEARFAVAQFALQAGQAAKALSVLDEALNARPGWESAALLKSQALSRKDGLPASLAYLEGFLRDYPQAREARLTYAKQLARAGRLGDSRQVFEQIAKESPDSPGAHFALGLVALQGNDLDNARTSLIKAMDLGHQDIPTIRLYLGQIEEAQGKLEQALTWYKGVDRSPVYLDARLRSATLMGKLGRVREAREWLAETHARNDGERVQLIQAETMILRDAKDLPGAYQALSQAIEKMPGAFDLLYDRAMLSEKRGQLDLMEKDLLQLIRLKPDYAHAYNALGYTLADRTARIDEAIKYLETALKLSPEDPFILDSMGWALFKAKRPGEAIPYLRRAFAAKPDPEIAAHLGESLWATGEREEAQRIWRASLQTHPDNEVLRETVSRLTR